jgi:hypothetical protein
MVANAQKAPNLNDYILNVDDLTNNDFVSLIKSKLANSQFVFVGEQHGIKAAAEVTNVLYNLAQSFDYKTLCIETDHLAAKRIEAMAASSDLVGQFRALNKEFPFAVPFYNNVDDQVLFKNVSDKGGKLWGIDQTFMAQFRLNFDLLMKKASGKKLKKRLEELKKEADDAFKETLDTKNFQKAYIFQYNETVHQELKALAKTPTEKEAIGQLWLTKEIYEYNFQRKPYQNNYVRSELMKSNFMRYYDEAKKSEPMPHVIFKLGAFHAARGLTQTNVYDIANLGSELAISNGKRSVHVAVLGITGEAAAGNPFATESVASFDNTNMLSEELKKAIEGKTGKYIVLDLEPLRDYGYGKTFSEAFKKNLFAYDLLILVNDAEAVKPF